MAEKKKIKVRMERIIASTKQRKQIPFFLSGSELEELEIPKPIWELPDLDLTEKLILTRIHHFGSRGGQPTNEELLNCVHSKVWQIMQIPTKRS